MPKYKIADIIFSYIPTYPYTESLCKNYQYLGSESCETDIVVSSEDIDKEKEYAKPLIFPEDYLESLALYRKFLTYAFDHDAIILHSSALAVDGDGYIFTAPSGTGKSTHARLWRETFGDKVVMVNDDKPVIRKIGKEFFVFGTPWNGKHHLDSNVKAKIKGICQLKRGKENSVSEISAKDMLFVLLNQTLRPETEAQVERLFTLLDELLTSVPLYQMHCNISKEAAELAYKTMSGKS